MHMLSKLFNITPTPTVHSGGSLFYRSFNAIIITKFKAAASE